MEFWTARAISIVLAIWLGAGLAHAQSGPLSEDDTTCTDDVMLVFDGSGSMASAGYNEMEYPRIHEALIAVRRVLPRVTAYRRIGLVVYGPGPKDACQNIEMKLAPAFNSAKRIIGELERVEPDGNTPLTEAVRSAAEAMNFRKRPAVVVLVTDGDETCGGAPCRMASSLVGEAAAITVHVIGFKVRGRFFQWQSQRSGMRGGETVSRCLADQTGGKFISTETTEELVAALQKTLGCPLMTKREEAQSRLRQRGVN
ncbi:MAG: VWA domain-containing protein [Alphaproteobacteria bacterium]|nr:VWA domain-containing protein [Alphaproteobacteria bacterium]